MSTDAASHISPQESSPQKSILPSSSTRVVIIGCGIIGAAIAYELSQVPHLQITVLDQQRPATESTGAALGVLMGAISQKKKGRAWALRDTSLRRYITLIPELEAKTGRSLPVNRDGIVLLQFDESPSEESRVDPDENVKKSESWRDRWQPLVELRQSQGWTLECWDQDQVRSRCPQIGERLGDRPIIGAVYSPQDLQINPVALTETLVEAAQINGVQFDFAAPVTALESGEKEFTSNSKPPPYRIHTLEQHYEADWVIVSAGLGSAQVTQSAGQPLDVRPVLGQAVRLHLSDPMGMPEFQPVISGDDIHIVPLGDGDYWVGATVEFPDDTGKIAADEALLQQILMGAIALCPGLSEATITQHWSGKRPRPWTQAAPVIQPLEGYSQVWLATGHYRNGVLLAPATAEAIRSVLESG